VVVKPIWSAYRCYPTCGDGVELPRPWLRAGGRAQAWRAAERPYVEMRCDNPGAGRGRWGRLCDSDGLEGTSNGNQCCRSILVA